MGLYGDFMGFYIGSMGLYGDLMGFYIGSMGYEWDVHSGNDCYMEIE